MVAGLRQSQLCTQPAMCMAGLRNSGCEAVRLDLPEVQQPQLRCAPHVQHAPLRCTTAAAALKCPGVTGPAVRRSGSHSVALCRTSAEQRKKTMQIDCPLDPQGLRDPAMKTDKRRKNASRTFRVDLPASSMQPSGDAAHTRSQAASPCPPSSSSCWSGPCRCRSRL